MGYSGLFCRPANYGKEVGREKKRRIGGEGRGGGEQACPYSLSRRPKSAFSLPLTQSALAAGEKMFRRKEKRGKKKGTKSRPPL